MKELFRDALARDYVRSLEDYLKGHGFNEKEAKAFEEFALLSMTKEIKMEQIYTRAVMQALKEQPGLCLELMKHADEIFELSIDYSRLSGEKDFAVVKIKDGVYKIIINN